MEQLTVTEKSGGNYILYKLDGVFNAYTAPNAQTKIYEGIKEHNVVLDMAGIIGMDLAAVGIIMAAHNDSSETGLLIPTVNNRSITINHSNISPADAGEIIFFNTPITDMIK